MRFALVCVCAIALVLSARALEVSSSVRPHVRVRDSVPPAIRGVLSQNGANYILNTALPVIFAKVKGLAIPEVDGTKSVPILGDVDYHLSNIKINQLAFANAGIALQNEVTAAITGVSVAITADWGYRQDSWPHISSDGSADISISNSGMSISLKMGVTPTGSPQLYVDSVNCDFEDLDISVHGSILSWLYDIIFDIAKNTIKSEAASAVSAELTSLINGLADQALASLALVVPLSNTTQLDMALVQAPALDNSNLVVSLKGQFENKTNPVPAPLPHVKFPSTLPSQQALLQLDEFIFNSGLWLMYQSGALCATVTQATLPPQVPFTLNTSTWAAVVPALATAFPNAAIEWRFGPLSQPSANITGQGLVAAASFSMQWLAADKSGQYQPAFTVQLDVGGVADLTLNATAIGGNFSMNTFTMTLLSSQIGSFDVTLLDTFFSAIAEGPIVQLLNQAFAQGIPLPVLEGVTLVNPHLTYHEDYADMHADLHITPPSAWTAALDRVVKARAAHPGRIRHGARSSHRAVRIN